MIPSLKLATPFTFFDFLAEFLGRDQRAANRIGPARHQLDPVQQHDRPERRLPWRRQELPHRCYISLRPQLL